MLWRWLAVGLAMGNRVSGASDAPVSAVACPGSWGRRRRPTAAAAGLLQDGSVALLHVGFAIALVCADGSWSVIGAGSNRRRVGQG